MWKVKGFLGRGGIRTQASFSLSPSRQTQRKGSSGRETPATASFQEQEGWTPHAPSPWGWLPACVAPPAAPALSCGDGSGSASSAAAVAAAPMPPTPPAPGEDLRSAFAQAKCQALGLLCDARPPLAGAQTWELPNQRILWAGPGLLTNVIREGALAGNTLRAPHSFP